VTRSPWVVGLILVAVTIPVRWAPPARAAMAQPTWTAGDYWDYLAVRPEFPQPGSMQFFVIGTEYATVGGISYAAYRVRIEGTFVRPPPTSGWTTLEGTAWYRTSDLALLMQYVNQTDLVIVPTPRSQTTFHTLAIDPPKSLMWPLTPGATWTSAGWVNESWFVVPGPGMTTWRKSMVNMSFSVEPERAVTVPSGTFTTTPLNGTAAGYANVTYWSPIVGNGVLIRQFAPGGVEVQRLELTQYRYGVSAPVTSLVVGAPSVTTDATYVTSSTLLSFVVLDQGGTGIRDTTYRIDGGTPASYADTGPFTAGAEGAHTVEWSSADNAGNTEPIRSASLRVDDTPPTTTLSPAGGPYTTSTIFTLTAADAGSGVNGTEFRLDGDAWTPYGGAFTIPAGDHVIGYRSVDRLDNAEIERTRAVAVAGPPPGPLTSLVTGNPSYTTSASYVTSRTPLSFTISDRSGTGIRRTTYRIEEGTWMNYTASGPFTLVGEGPHDLAWSSEDFAGNVEPTTTATLRVDDTPPTTTFAAGDPRFVAENLFVASSTPISLAAADGGVTPAGVALVEYGIDGGPWTPYMAPLSLVGEGPHVVEFRSSDFLGNSEPARSASVVVDDTPPTVAIDIGAPRHAGGDMYVRSATPFTLAATDGGTAAVGVAGAEYRLGGAWTPYATPFTLPGPDGPKIVEVRATDLLGHAATGQLAVVLDDTPPVTTPSRADGTYASGTTFAFTATDAGSGVARTEVRVDDGTWATYTTPVTLGEGAHTILFRSADRLNNTEAERTLSVAIAGKPFAPPEPNWKPVVAALFASALALVGAWSAMRAPWRTGSRRSLRAFALTALPFVLAEAGTGVVSLLFGLLSIPPLLGPGTVVDTVVLLAGIAFALYRVRRGTLRNRIGLRESAENP